MRILTFLLASLFITGFAQDPLSDTIKKIDSLSVIKKEQNPNYFGFNITPLMSGIITTSNDYNVKVGAVYKHNLGYKNIRFGMNYLTEGSNSFYDYYIPLNTSDTSILYRYFESNYHHYDFRIGFEELRGYSNTRVHIGADLIIGTGRQDSKYFHRFFMLDSTNKYVLTPSSTDQTTSQLLRSEGNRSSSYLITGIDVSFGFDWVLNEDFLLTFQITPQFNYYIFRSENLFDPYQEYIQFGDYADFKLGYIDLNLIYKF